MILRLKRFYSNAARTLGLLFADDELLAFVLEDAKHDVKIPTKTRIPAGSYPVTLAHSPKFSPKYGHDMISIEGVPFFSSILIHPGNTELDTAGCLLVGASMIIDPKEKNRQWIADSKVIYSNRVYPTIAAACRAGVVDLLVEDADG